jgi:hypothetical protein
MIFYETPVEFKQNFRDKIEFIHSNNIRILFFKSRIIIYLGK